MVAQGFARAIMARLNGNTGATPGAESGTYGPGNSGREPHVGIQRSGTQGAPASGGSAPISQTGGEQIGGSQTYGAAPITPDRYQLAVLAAMKRINTGKLENVLAKVIQAALDTKVQIAAQDVAEIALDPKTQEAYLAAEQVRTQPATAFATTLDVDKMIQPDNTYALADACRKKSDGKIECVLPANGYSSGRFRELAELNLRYKIKEIKARIALEEDRNSVGDSRGKVKTALLGFGETAGGDFKRTAAISESPAMTSDGSQFVYACSDLNGKTQSGLWINPCVKPETRAMATFNEITFVEGLCRDARGNYRYGLFEFTPKRKAAPGRHAA